MDINSILGTGKEWKQVIGQINPPLFWSEPDNYNQNPSECAIQIVKDGVSKIINACGTRVLTYEYETMEYLCNVNNYVARDSLKNQLPYEVFWG